MAENDRAKFLPALAFISLFFLGVVLQLREEWSVNPQYFYGWGVPILGIILARNRWNCRPAADLTQPRHERLLFVVAVALLIIWLPLRVLREANMDWRLLQWVIAVGGMAFVLGAVYWMGGRSWLGHFFFPVAFVLLAVPWPTRFENGLIQTSTQFVVRGVVEALRWMGYAAWSAGNVIQLPATSVGVDEACSGLRSFQGSIMCALFLGELKRLSWARRAVLVVTGVLVALGLNFLRTLALTTIAAQGGVPAVDLWHDTAGVGTLLVAFGLLWVAAHSLGARRGAESQPEISDFRPISARVAIACAAWLILVEGASALWFRVHEGPRVDKLWKFEPANVAGLREEPISPRVQNILRFDEGAAFRRSLPDGTEWWVYSIEWARDGGGAPLARFHSPEVCLPAAGLKLAARGALFYPVGEDLPFRPYQFDWRGKPVFIFSSFYSSTRSGAIASMDEFDLTWSKRLRMARAGQRPAEQRVFQVLISGSPSERAAREAFEQFVAQTLRRET